MINNLSKISMITNKNNIVKDGLVLHLDASNASSYPGTGTTWYDISGNNRNFSWVSTPSFTTSNPSYFATNVRCTGPASNSFGINNTSGYTIFVACNQITLLQTHAFNFYGSVGYNRGIFAHLTWSDNIVYFDQGGCCASNTRTAVGSGGSQSWNIWTFRRFTSSSTRTISKNGSTLTTNTAAAADINLNSTAAAVVDNATWNARLNIFLVYNRGLSDLEIQQNYNVLKGRYGL